MAPRTNRYPGPCARCAAPVPAEAGTLIGPPWATVCATCLPRPSAAAGGARVEVRLVGAEVAIELVGFAGPAWGAFRAAVDGCRWSKADGNRASVELFGRQIASRLAACGLPVDVAPEVTAALQALAARTQGDRAAAAGRAAAADLALQARGLALFPFQAIGVDWLSGREAALLGDDMGCGKSVQTLLAAPTGAPILVVCPAVAKGVWVREAGKWRPDLRPVPLSGRGSFRWPAAGEIVIVNYDLLPGDTSAPKGAAVLPVELAAAPAGTCLVLDEIHAAKSGKAQRTRRARAIAIACRAAGGRVWGLTATPILNRGPELWSVLSVLGLEREVFGTYQRFLDLFSATPTGYRGALEWGTPSPEVAPRLGRAMLRRLKTEVLRDLPPKRLEELTVDIEGKDRKALDKIVAELAKRGVDLDAAISGAKRSAGGVAFEELSRARAVLATAKAAAALALVEECEEAGEPVVVFSAHRAPIDMLGDRDGWAAITGDTSADERTAIEGRMQAGELRGVACTIKAGGVAITLTRAARAIFVDQEWTPALNSQAADRIYRIGQSRGVLVTLLIADHRIDERLAELLVEKGALVDATVEAASKTGDDVAGDSDAAALDAAAAALEEATAAARAALEEAARYEAEIARIIASIPPARPGDRHGIGGRHGHRGAHTAAIAEAEARRRAAARRIEAAAEGEGCEPRAAQGAREEWAQAALVTLTALNDDLATEENGVGWNKADTGYGGQLARKVVAVGLTPTEWRVAIGMCGRYWRQIGRMPQEGE